MEYKYGSNAMSVDVEDYFQVSAFDEIVSREDWPKMKIRLPRNVDRILELFEANDVRGTFFTLGWVCKRMPEVVRRIANLGHEIGSHGQNHVRIGNLSAKSFRKDAEGSRKLLEDTTGKKVSGYRAPSFSIGETTPWAHEVLRESGYSYSSSIYPIKHDHYGAPDAPSISIPRYKQWLVGSAFVVSTYSETKLALRRRRVFSPTSVLILTMGN